MLLLYLLLLLPSSCCSSCSCCTCCSCCPLLVAGMAHYVPISTQLAIKMAHISALFPWFFTIHSQLVLIFSLILIPSLTSLFSCTPVCSLCPLHFITCNQGAGPELYIHGHSDRSTSNLFRYRPCKAQPYPLRSPGTCNSNGLPDPYQLPGNCILANDGFEWEPINQCIGGMCGGNWVVEPHRSRSHLAGLTLISLHD